MNPIDVLEERYYEIKKQYDICLKNKQDVEEVKSIMLQYKSCIDFLMVYGFDKNSKKIRRFAIDNIKNLDLKNSMSKRMIVNFLSDRYNIPQKKIRYIIESDNIKNAV